MNRGLTENDNITDSDISWFTNRVRTVCLPVEAVLYLSHGSSLSAQDVRVLFSVLGLCATGGSILITAGIRRRLIEVSIRGSDYVSRYNRFSVSLRKLVKAGILEKVGRNGYKLNKGL